MTKAYRGRFAPSPTGRLHAGSLLAALGSWLDARAHEGAWVVRVEDIDPFRDIPGAGEAIVETLKAFGLESDEPVLWQHDRMDEYRKAIRKLVDEGKAFPCACSRRDVIAWHVIHGGDPAVYPGTCRNGTHGRTAHSVRFRVDREPVSFTDRRLGFLEQNLEEVLGDFVIQRGDGLPAYQLAVVLDDGFQGITDVIRGEDLFDNTPRQIALQRGLGLPTPRYLHLPLVLNDRGEKLSKQGGATPVDAGRPLEELGCAWARLGFPALGADSVGAFFREALRLWKERWDGAGA